MKTKKKILLLGSKGKAGHVLYYMINQEVDYLVHDLSRNNKYFNSTYNIDVRDWNKLKSILKNNKYDFVINCIGILNSKVKENIGNTIIINSYLPHFLSQLSIKYGFRLIHISTDGVFSGALTFYKENDIKDAIDLYSVSKSLGEIENNRDLTIRTSIIGPCLENTGIFNWFISQKSEVMGFTNSIWSGVTTIELAKFIMFIIRTPIGGVYHLTNEIGISKYNLLQLLNNEFKKNSIKIIPTKDVGIKRVLLNTRKNIQYKVPTYFKMILEINNWINKNHNLYSHKRNFINP